MSQDKRQRFECAGEITVEAAEKLHNAGLAYEVEDEIYVVLVDEENPEE